MFQSVVQQSAGASRFGSGVWVSLAVHAALLAAALLVSGSTQKAPPLEEISVVFHPTRPPAPAPVLQTAPATQPPRPTEKKPVADRVKPRPPPRELRLVPPSPEPRPESPPDDSPTDSGEGPVGPVTDASAAGPSGPVCADCVVGPALTARGTDEDVLPFGEGMTPPRLLSEAVPLRYTPEASRAGVEGLLIARCTITLQGEVRHCRVIKGLPFMDEAVLESLAGRRYQPVTFQGRPVSALYTFNVRLRMP